MRLGEEGEYQSSVASSEKSEGSYAFGPFLLDLRRRQLARREGGSLVLLPRKAWQILVMLVEADGGLVAHDAFRRKLWPRAVVEDRTLTVHMSTLRKALGSGPASTLIETVPGHGYRLAVRVEIGRQVDTQPSQTSGLQTRPLAVRGFSTRGLAASDSYLGVGLADALTTALGGVPGLTVSPAMEDSESATDAVEAGRALGLGHVLEGSLHFHDKELQVSARLIDIASGRTQWSERFARPRENGSELQDVIVQRVARSVGTASTADNEDFTSYRPHSTEAYFLQLQARANLRSFLRLPTMKALGLFEQAIALDPEYALAHAGLASTYLRLASTALVQALASAEAMPIAHREAERALALDDRLAEAWATLGRVKMEYDWDWDGAEADLEHAVGLNPSSIEALAAYGEYLSVVARHDEAIDTLEKARRLDPRNVQTLQHLSLAYWVAGNGERALELATESQIISPQAIQVVAARSSILDQLGRHAEAMAARVAFLRELPEASLFAQELEELDRTQGWEAAMRVWLARLESKARWETAAVQWMALGQSERALNALEHCVDQKTTYVRFTAVLPSFRPLHNHPRFGRILQTLKLDGRLA